MFGSCALNKGLSFLFITLLFPLFTWAQQAQKGTVVADEAMVYQDPDFDAPVLATLRMGQVFNISTGKKNGFFKIRLKPGTTGWISDAEVRPGAHKMASKEELKEYAEEAEKKGKPYFASRYRGLSLDMINYTEDTMGGNRNAPTIFYGLNFHGFNTLFSGDIFTESNLLFHSGAPTYYQDYTKQSASGFIFIADFLFQTVVPTTENFLYYYGFGPMFKYSHFELQLANGSVVNSYSADDMTLGVLFNLGVGVRLGSFSLRPQVKYYWEKSGYFGGSLNVGYLF